MLKKVVLVLVVLLAGGYAAAEVAAKGYAESRLVAFVTEKDPLVSDVEADVSAPVLFGLVTTGEVRRIHLAASHVAAGALAAERVEATFHGVALDRGASVRRREPIVTAIDRLEVAAEVSAEALSKLLPAGLRLELGRGTVTLVGPGISVGGRLALRPPSSIEFLPGAGGLPLGVSVPLLRITGIPWVSCVQELTFEPGFLRVACAIEDPPPRLPP